MSERYATIYMNPNQIITINDRSFTADEYGRIDISESNLFATIESPTGEFENYLAEQLIDAKQISTLNMMARSGKIMISTLTALLDGDREKAREILNMGVRVGVLCRGDNCDWKVATKMFKERMLAKAELLQKFITTGKGKPVSDVEMVKQSLKSIKGYEENNEEEVAYDPEVEGSVKENVHSIAIKPGVPINKKVLTKKKPALSKPLVVNKKRT